MKRFLSLFVLGIFVFGGVGVFASEANVRYYVGDLVPYTNGENTTLYSVTSSRIVLETFWSISRSTMNLKLWESFPTKDGGWMKLIEIDSNGKSALFEVLSDEEWYNIRNEALEKCKEGIAPSPESDLNECPTYCEDEPYNMACKCRNGYRVWNDGCSGTDCNDTRNYYTCENTPREVKSTGMPLLTKHAPVEKFELNESQRIKDRVLNYLNETECPENCRCVGAVIKCYINGTREMTVIAGASGNIIIQTKGINATTRVEIIREGNETLMNISGQMKSIRVMPDEAFEKVKDKIRVSKCNNENNCSVELDENGKYEIRLERRSKILGVFPKKMNIRSEVDAESGDLVIKKPWWAIIASEPTE